MQRHQSRVPVWFHARDEGLSDPPGFDCALDPAEPSFAGQSGCLDRIEVMAGDR